MKSMQRLMMFLVWATVAIMGVPQAFAAGGTSEMPGIAVMGTAESPGIMGMIIDHLALFF
jgi:hypothetical protein